MAKAYPNKKKKQLRQGLTVSIEQLEDLMKSLRKQRRAFKKKYNIPVKDMSFIVVIINNLPECSDTWELEAY